MGDGVIIIVFGVLGALGAVAAVYFGVARKQSNAGQALIKIKEVLEQRHALFKEIEQQYTLMVHLSHVREKVKELLTSQESLKAERGRITITQAELETVENRLRELEEIERELEASTLETKEELNILKRKEEELAQKNAALKKKLAETSAELDKLFAEIELSSQAKEHVQNMKTEMVQTEQKIDLLMIQIEQGNEQYFTLKKRYDALDIEYAQLYEKFSEAEMNSRVEAEE